MRKVVFHECFANKRSFELDMLIDDSLVAVRYREGNECCDGQMAVESLDRGIGLAKHEGCKYYFSATLVLGEWKMHIVRTSDEGVWVKTTDTDWICIPAEVDGTTFPEVPCVPAEVKAYGDS